MYEPEEKIYLVKVNRAHEYFKHRSIKFGTFTDKGMKITKNIPYPDNQFNCDFCNKTINSELINKVSYLKNIIIYYRLLVIEIL